jgi:hypothetical protein
MSQFTPQTVPIPRHFVSLRVVRPSLLDLRFTGDPWIVRREDGSCAICLGDTPLAGIRAVQLDLPSLNSVIDRMRHPRHRHRKVRG